MSDNLSKLDDVQRLEILQLIYNSQGSIHPDDVKAHFDQAVNLLTENLPAASDTEFGTYALAGSSEKSPAIKPK